MMYGQKICDDSTSVGRPQLYNFNSDVLESRRMTRDVYGVPPPPSMMGYQPIVKNDGYFQPVANPTCEEMYASNIHKSVRDDEVIKQGSFIYGHYECYQAQQ